MRQGIAAASICRALLPLLAFCLAILLSAPAARADGRLYVLSIPDDLVAPGERIASVSLRMKGARLHSFREIPVGWTWQIGNHGSMHTDVEGLAEVGAAALDVDFVDELFVIEPRAVVGLAFDVELVLHVTTDFSVTRDLTLRQPQLVLKPRTQEAESADR